CAAPEVDVDRACWRDQCGLGHSYRARDELGVLVDHRRRGCLVVLDDEPALLEGAAEGVFALEEREHPNRRAPVEALCDDEVPRERVDSVDAAARALCDDLLEVKGV